MKNLIFVLGALFLSAGLGFGSTSSHHEASVADLFYPAINSGIYLVLFLWKGLPLISRHFQEQHIIVKNFFNAAAIKLNEVTHQKESIEKDLAELGNKKSEMEISSNRDLDMFRSRYRQELDDKRLQLEHDLGYSLEFEKRACWDRFFSSVVADVAEETKRVIDDSELQGTKYSTKLLKSLTTN